MRSDHRITNWYFWNNGLIKKISLVGIMTKITNEGFALWLTGLSASGKTILGKRIYEYLKKSDKRPVELIDGDVVREFFGKDLGYTRPDRIANIKRIIFAGALLSRNGVITIVANIAPYYEIRDFARKKIENYYQVYLKASAEDCEKRDYKNQYAKARKGMLKNFIGIDDVYNVPRNPDLILDTVTETEEESFKKITEFLRNKGLIL